MGQCVREAAEKSAVHAGRVERVDDVPVPGKDFKRDFRAGFPGEILPQGLVALHLPEEVLLGDQSDQQFLHGRFLRGRGRLLGGTGREGQQADDTDY